MPRHFDDWLKAYMSFTQYNETPDVFHFCTGISTIAAVLQRKVWLDERYFKWYPNFYILLVAPPGVVSKTTTTGTGLGLLREVPGVHMGPEVLTWQALVKALSDAKELFYEPGINGPLEQRPMLAMCCLTCAPGELGTFFDPQDRRMVDVLNSLYDGKDGPWEKWTVTMGQDKPENVLLNIIGPTTPSWIADNFPKAMIGSGFTSRVLFCYTDKKRRLIPYPSDEFREETYHQQKQQLIEDLRLMGDLSGQFSMSADARAWGRLWYEKLWTERPGHLASERYGGYLARKQTHIHKLAMVLAVSRGSDLIIELRDIQSAERFITSLERDMEIVFQDIGLAESSRLVREVLAYVSVRRSVPRIDLWRHCMPLMSVREFTECLTAGIQAGYIRERTEGNQVIVYAIKREKTD